MLVGPIEKYILKFIFERQDLWHFLFLYVSGRWSSRVHSLHYKGPNYKVF